MRAWSLLLVVCLPAASGWAQTPSVSVAPAPVDSSFAHARQLLQEGKYDEAISELKQIAVAQPEKSGLAHELGTAYYRKGDYPHAIESLKQALQQDPSNNEATQLLGLSYYL